MTRPTVITGYFVIICVLGCLLAYPLYLITGADFERIVSRTILVLAVLLFYPTCKLLKINNITSLGWVKTKALKSFSLSWALGVMMLIPISWVYFNCGFRAPETNPLTISIVLTAILAAFISGLIIGLIEESVFRGLLHSQLRHSMSNVSVIIIVSVIYSSVHFLQSPDNFTLNQVEWFSGFTLLASAFSNLGNINLIFDAWVALFLAGVFLSLVRIQTSNLIWCIGIHAGWVTHIKIFKEFTDRDSSASCAYLASDYDNYVGELSAAWIVLVLAIWGIVYWRKKQANY